jgi:hypothetical protein
MSSITDNYMDKVLKTRPSRTPSSCSKAALGPKEPDADKLIREHGGSNLKLRKDGTLDLIIALMDEGEIWGFDVFNTDVDETRRIMENDPAVQAAIMVCETHAAVSFPGDALSG